MPLGFSRVSISWRIQRILLILHGLAPADDLDAISVSQALEAVVERELARAWQAGKVTAEDEAYIEQPPPL